MVHELKCWPNVYKDYTDGVKPWAIRRDDRNYAVGDILHLNEWRPEDEQYTGNSAYARVMYILRGEQAETFGCKPGYCVMTLGPL